MAALLLGVVLAAAFVAMLVFSKKDAAATPAANAQPTVVVDVRMPFLSMVVFVVKWWSLAAIPAMIVLFMVGAVALVFLRALLFR